MPPGWWLALVSTTTFHPEARAVLFRRVGGDGAAAVKRI
jgi:hypothetical protein